MKSIAKNKLSLAWLLISGIILMVWLFAFPTHIQYAAEDWTISQAVNQIESVIPGQVFLIYIFTWQTLGASLYLLTSLVVFKEVILPGKPEKHLAFWVSTILLLSPILLYMNAAGSGNFQPGILGNILEVVWEATFFLTIIGYLGLFFILPYGVEPPGWARWVTLVYSLGLLLVLGLLLSEIAGDVAWGLLMGMVFVGLLLGWFLQVLRYRRYLSSEEKTQSRWIVLALILNPIWILAALLSDSIVSASGSGWFSIIALHMQLFLPMLLPLAIMYALLKLGYWGALPADRWPVMYARLGIILFVGLAGISLGIQINAIASTPDPSQPWSLPEGVQPKKVIVDTDMGNDDVLGLLYLMQHPGVELQAVTVVGTGLVHCEPGVKNVQGLLALTDYPNIPVSCGSEEPIGAEYAFPEAWRKAADRLWGLGLPPNDRQPAPQPAPELLSDLLMRSDQPLDVLALGPLTNLAQALQANPSLIRKIDRLFMMGGAVDVPGNVYDPNLGFENRTAEWNIYADPVAAQIVFESGVPITMVPLDATNDVPVRLPFYNLLENYHKTRAATFTFDIFYINLGWIQSGGYYLWDTLASTVLTNPEVATFQDYNLQVVTEPGPDYGRTLPTSDGIPVQVATQADPAFFEEIFLRVINTERSK